MADRTLYTGRKTGIRLYSELTKAQRKDVRSRMKAPYGGYLYKIESGKVVWRQRRK